MSLVFFVHHPVNGFRWLQAYRGIMEFGLEKAAAVRKMIESYSITMRVQLARRRVFHACEALHGLGIKIAVSVYDGSLAKTR